MKENKGNTILLTIIGVATLLIAVVGATFAYFTAIVTGNESVEVIKISSGTIGTEYNEGTVIALSNIYPLPAGQPAITKQFSIQANMTATTQINYKINMGISKNTFGSVGDKDDVLTYSVEKEEEFSEGIGQADNIGVTGIKRSDTSITLVSGFFSDQQLI